MTSAGRFELEGSGERQYTDVTEYDESIGALENLAKWRLARLELALNDMRCGIDMLTDDYEAAKKDYELRIGELSEKYNDAHAYHDELAGDLGMLLRAVEKKI